MTCSTTDPQAQEAARGRVVGILLAGEIADAAAITTAMRCICFCYGQPMGQGLLIGKGLLRSEKYCCPADQSVQRFRKSLVCTDNTPQAPEREPGLRDLRMLVSYKTLAIALFSV